MEACCERQKHLFVHLGCFAISNWLINLQELNTFFDYGFQLNGDMSQTAKLNVWGLGLYVGTLDDTVKCAFSSVSVMEPSNTSTKLLVVGQFSCNVYFLRKRTLTWRATDGCRRTRDWGLHVLRFTNGHVWAIAELVDEWIGLFCVNMGRHCSTKE